jgi:hypothetical protein
VGDRLAHRQQGDDQADQRGGDVQDVARAVEVEEVPVLADGEQAVEERGAVADREQPAIGARPGKGAGQQQAGDADHEVHDVVQRVDVEDQQRLVGVPGEVVEAGDEEADDADEHVHRTEGESEDLRQGAASRGGGSSGHVVLLRNVVRRDAPAVRRSRYPSTWRENGCHPSGWRTI